MALSSNVLDAPKAPTDHEAPSPRTLANRRNALRSTGPKTETGKAASRRNAVKTGLTGAGVVLPGEMEEERRANVEAWKGSLRPTDEVEAQVVEMAASTMVRLRRCWREEALARARAVDRADLAWDLDREADLARLTKGLEKDPVSVVPRMRRSLHGARWMLAQWAALGEILESGRPWTEPHRQFALDLLAVPAIFRDGLSPVDPPMQGDATEHRLKVVADEMARLERDIDGSLAALDEDERALHLNDIVLRADSEVARLSGYESRLNGRLLKLLDRIWSKGNRRAEAKPDRPKAPAPVAPPAPPVAVQPPPKAPEPPPRKVEPSARPVSAPAPVPRGGSEVLGSWATPAAKVPASDRDKGRGEAPRPDTNPSKRSQ